MLTSFFLFFKSRRGELAIQWVVVAVLAILFLVILALVYSDQLSKVLGGFSDIISDVLGFSDKVDIKDVAT